jgi:hypothetical protein
LETTLAVAMIVMGAGIAGIWTRDILAGERVDRSRGVLRARESGTGALLWLHWVAEYATAAALFTGGAGLLADAGWAPMVAAAALGALSYTSLNSLGWALATADRRPYAVPMVVGAVVGLTGAYLVVR